MYTEAYRISYLAIKYRVGAVCFFFWDRNNKIMFS